MPELPEVETVRRDLQQGLRGRFIERIEILNSGSVRGLPVRRFIRELKGRRFTKFARRGKYLLCGISSGKTLVIHLRMTGVLILQSAHEQLPAMARVVFYFRGNGRLAFADQRKFGLMELVDDPQAVPGIAGLGPEPLEQGFTAGALRIALQSRTGPVKTVLLDQRAVAGLGNIYALEALHRAGIAPWRKSNGLTKIEIAKLHRAIKAVLRAAIAARGSSVDTYRDGRGRQGWFQTMHRVYGREGKKCRRCGNVIRKVQFRGRGTYWCPKCQR